MKKLLLILTASLLAWNVSAQKFQEYDLEKAQQMVLENGTCLSTTNEGEITYFDPAEGRYLPEKEFSLKYGKKTLRRIQSIEEGRLAAEAEEAAEREKQAIQTEAIRKLQQLDTFESVSYSKNSYAEILDGLDGTYDGDVDYLNTATFFRDLIAGIDKNGNISMVNIIACPDLSKEQIYIQANSWFVNSFNSGKSVIQLNDKDAGTILAKGFLKNIAEQVGFAMSYEVSAYVIFRIDIKEGRARLITTIQEYESVNRGGVAGAIAGNTKPTTGTYKPEANYPFAESGGGLSKKAGAKAYCACCMYMIALKNQLEKAITVGILGSDMEEW